MHCTALGKSVLAFLPPTKARAVLMRHGMPRYTHRTIVALSPMDRELARVRRQGYAIDDVEFEEGVRCMGAPIFDHRGTPIAAISISAPLSRMPLAKTPGLGAMVREGAASVSRAMGWGSGASRHAAVLIPVHGRESFVRRSGSLGRPLVPRRRSAPHQAKEVIGQR